jgi:hypothetical protein
MAVPAILPIEFLRECFSYDPETGVIRWRTRPEEHFPSAADAAAWNTQNAGTVAFASPDASGYCRAEVRYEGRRLRLTAGRVAFVIHHGSSPRIVDHVDGDTTNNRIDNLRAASDAENMWNRRRGKDRGGVPRGAYPGRNRRWYAQANQHNRKVYLGVYDTMWQAHDAYCAFVRRERGDFFTGPPVGVFA